MAGSKGGKHSKSKGKSKSKKSETSHKKPEVFNSKLDQAQNSNNAHRPKESKGKNPKPNATTGGSKYTEQELEEFLYVKLEDLYTKAKGWLLTSGYGMADVERAILNNGYIHGPKDLLNNILTNSVAFIEQKVKAKGEAFKDMSELYKSMIETLVDSMVHTEPNLQRSDAMWLLLVRSWGSVPSTTTTSHLQSEDQNMNSIFVHESYGSTSDSRNEDAGAPDSSSAAEKVLSESNIQSSSKRVGILERINLTPALVSQLRQNIPILTAAVQEQIGASVIEQQAFQNACNELTEGSDVVGSDILTFINEACLKRWLEGSPNDPKIALIVDLMKSIRNLQEKVKVQKEWAQQKVIDSAKRLSKDLLELKILEMEKVATECWKDERLCAEKSCMLMLMETEQSLRNVNCEVSFITESIRTLEISNAQIRADTEALKLSASESKGDLNEVLNRERRCMKKITNIEKQTSNFRAQCDEEKQRVLQLQLEVFQAEKEAEKAEVRLLELNLVTIYFLC